MTEEEYRRTPNPEVSPLPNGAPTVTEGPTPNCEFNLGVWAPRLPLGLRRKGPTSDSPPNGAPTGGRGHASKGEPLHSRLDDCHVSPRFAWGSVGRN